MEKPTIFKFRLYVAQDTPNSARASTNLNALCHEYLAGRYEIEVVDVFAQSKRALEDNIMMTPTLIRVDPLPVVKIIGTLSDQALVLQKLGLEAN